MRKCILISACLAAAFGLLGCEIPSQHYKYTIYYQGVPVEFDSPYDDPGFYRGGGKKCRRGTGAEAKKIFSREAPGDFFCPSRAQSCRSQARL